MNHSQLIDELLQELSYRVGIVNIYNKEHQSIMSEILTEWGEFEAKYKIMNFLNEEGENKNDDKYVSVGFGRYKYKGKEGEDDPTYEKDDKGNYIKLGDGGGGEEQSVETGKALKTSDYQKKVEQEKETRKEIESDSKSPQKTEPESKGSDIPNQQIDHYKKVSQEESVQIEGDTSKKDREKSLQNLYAKLQLISMGESIELSEADISNLSKLVISGNARSGQLYDSTVGTSKADGIQSVSKDSYNYGNRNIDKNVLLTKWSKVVEYMDSKGISKEARPKFKAGVNTLIDNPPKIGHSPVSMKPNRLMESVPKAPANELLELKTLTDLKEKQGIEVGDDDLFGKPLDRNNPKTFLDNIGLVVNSTQSYIDGVNSPDTKVYFDKFNDGINTIINDESLSDDQKLEKINKELPQLFTQLYNDALEVSDDEAKNVLKDFGELVVYMDYLSQKEEVYLPVSGNYPLGDVIVVKRDGNGEALTIDSVSIKSQRGKEEQPGSSAMEFCKHFANVYPEHKNTFESLGALHTNSVDKVKFDDISDSQMKKEIESIQKLDEMKSFDDAKKVCDELGLDWDKVKTSLERTHYPKYKNQVKLTAESMKNVVKELVYRQYSFKKTLDTMGELNLPTKLKFVEVVVEPDEVAVRPKGENSTTADFGPHDKGYLGKGKVEKDPPPPHVGPVKYESANMALRYKPKK